VTYQKQLALTFLGVLALLAWYLASPYTCLSLAIILGVTLVVTASIASYWMQKRRCFVNCYFQEDALITRILSGRIFLTFIALYIASFVIVFLFASITAWSFYIWLIIGFDILFLAGIYYAFSKIFSNSLKKTIGKPLLKSWSVGLNTILLTLFISYYDYQTLIEPDYIRGTLKETLQEATKERTSECNAIDTLIKLNAEKDATIWYVTLYTDKKVSDNENRWLLWIFFLIQGGIIYYGFSRFFIELITFEPKQIEPQ